MSTIVRPIPPPGVAELPRIGRGHGRLERSSKQGALDSWAPISRWMGEKFAVLVHEENYAFVMDHFCDSVDLTAFPNSSGVKVTENPRWLKVTYRGGCPESDPSFAEAGHQRLEDRRAFPQAGSRSLEGQPQDAHQAPAPAGPLLSVEACCNIPYVERSLYAAFYPTARIGSDCTLYDFLMNERALTAEQGTVAGDCCRQGG